MASEKKYYWIKLKDSFLTSDAVDFLMSQPNGANYVVLYQMICLKTVNTNGVLARQLGDVLVEYDVHKIQRDCKHFSLDTVRVAIELYKKLKLVYEMENGILRISEFEKLIGSEVSSASRVREYREKKKALHCNANVTQEKEIKILDIRDKEIKILDKDKEVSSTQKRSFVKPTLEEVISYCKERNNKIEANRFIDFYEAKGWKIGKEQMKDWKACIRTWEQRDTNKPPTKYQQNTNKGKKDVVDYMSNKPSEEELDSLFDNLEIMEG